MPRRAGCSANFPAGVHGRPDGASATIVLFNHHGEPVAPEFPLPDPPPHYAEIALRGMSTMVPALRAYEGKPQRPYVDGGYYVRTRENRPLIGPAPVEGAYISCGYSGFGVMASCGGGELIARHITEGALPDYAAAFMLSRYQDKDYAALLETWGDGGQLVITPPRARAGPTRGCGPASSGTRARCAPARRMRPAGSVWP